MTRNFWLSCLALLPLIWIVAHFWARSGGAHAPPKANTQGQKVYEGLCAMCHEATDLHLLKNPPKLDGLFQRQTFPSGAPATDEKLRNVILYGRGIMPPFEQMVNSDDLNALVQYMHTR